MPDIKRQTAYKCTIEQINKGKYVVQQGWEPNYIELGQIQASRINILAALVSKEGNTLTLDDGTGSIEARLFDNPEKADGLTAGDIIMIIGRPREYAGKRYITPEIIRKITDKKWIEHRRKELEKEPIIIPFDYEESSESEKKEAKKEAKKETKEQEAEEIPRSNFSAVILKTIKELDTGAGADIDEVIKKSKLEDAEKYIEMLLNEGEIFELRAGKIKILE